MTTITERLREIATRLRRPRDGRPWAAYSRAWPEAMAGMREHFIAGSSLGRRELVQPGGLDWSDADEGAKA